MCVGSVVGSIGVGSKETRMRLKLSGGLSPFIIELFHTCCEKMQFPKNVMAYFCSLLVTSLFVPFSSPQSTPFPSDIRWGAEIETKLTELVSSVISVEAAQKVYKPEKYVTLEKISGEKIRDDVLRELERVLGGKRRALKRLVDTGEQNVAYFDQTFGSMLSLEEVSFFNMKSPPPFHTIPYSSRFRQRVSFNQSGVHIPLEIFDGWMGPRYKESWWHDPQMLNGLNWTHTLDEVFKQNMEEDPAMSWQYFGSTYGFMRVYPAFRWPDHPSLPDLFDVRRRSWYIQGSVSPKDMIILIDRSGSVHGQTLDIMKITVRALLNSLSENDYVNVAWFNNQVKWVVPCINTLVQATAQNRRLLSDAVERLTESNLTSYAAALDFAFEALRRFEEERKPWGGSNCHKAIMFLSDGGTDWPEELVTQHCNQSRTNRIKIFTFACGPHPIPTVVLKEMACATGGYFSPITALGSVRVKIQDYVRVLSRPLAYSLQSDLYQWHNFYRDIGGLGMMTTVTLPVYSKLENETSDRLLGVMGIDIPVDEMINLFPKHALGPFGYPFSINLNGFVVFHPRLRDHIVYLEDPPDVDLLDLEGYSPLMESVRKNMIDGKLGKLLGFKSLIPVGPGHAIRVELDYFYGAINASTFRFGIAVPSEELKARVTLPNIEQAITALQSLDGLLIAPWQFCSFNDDNEDLTPSELTDRIRANLSNCDETLINHLLWDAIHANEIQEIWRRNSVHGIYSRFLMTTGGVSIIQPSNVAEIARRQLDPFRNTLFKWASRATGCVLSVSRGRSYDLTAACRILYQNRFVAAVIGVEMERDLVQNVMNEVTDDKNEEINCSEPDQLHCYLLNGGGVVVATNQPEVRAGEFIGQHDSQILAYMRENRILGAEHRFNYHSWCSKQTYTVQPTSTGSVLSSSFWDLITSLNFVLFYDFVFLLFSSFALWSGVDSKDAAVVDVSNHSCVTRSSWYHLDERFQCSAGNVSCEMDARKQVGGTFWCQTDTGPCEREIRVHFLPNVTSILVIATRQCDCFPKIPLESVDPQDVGPDHCDVRQPYRKRPTECFVDVPESNNTDCGAGSASMSIAIRLLNPMVLLIPLLLSVK